jgi:hypothetical protein
MSNVIAFPPRGRPRAAPVQARALGSLVKWQDAGGAWIVDHHSESGDSIGMAGRFRSEFEADRFIRSWKRENGYCSRIGRQMAEAHDDPEGAA